MMNDPKTSGRKMWVTKDKPGTSWMHFAKFLAGIEGFDNHRTEQYMRQLLENHYDSISVLKLATKQDLVEDAGIAPGDALRIVAAAKDYQSESAEHVHKSGGINCSVRHALKGGLVAQKTLSTRQNAEHPASPRQESLQRESKPAAKSARDVPYHTCGICDVTCTSAKTLRSHFKGQRHAYNIQHWIERDSEMPRLYCCSICKIFCTCKKDLVMHFNGKKHLMVMKDHSDEDY